MSNTPNSTQKPANMQQNSNNEIPDGLGKDINDYLNHYVTVADAKAAAILASNFLVLGALTTIEIKTCILIAMFFITGLVSLFSIFYCIRSLYPRLGHAGKGPIFWESIKKHNSLNEYLDELAKLDVKAKEIEYGKQNWHVSHVLSKKNGNVRLALWTFGLSLLFLATEFLISKF